MDSIFDSTPQLFTVLAENPYCVRCALSQLPRCCDDPKSLHTRAFFRLEFLGDDEDHAAGGYVQQLF
ncbi:MAG: hypothetical protein V9G16_05290 [Nitrosomonas sp.]